MANSPNRQDLFAGRKIYEIVFRHASDAILLLKGNRFIDCNPKAEAIFSGSREQIIQCMPHELSPEYQPDGTLSEEKSIQYLKKAGNNDSVLFDWRHQALDGRIFDAEISLSQVEIGGEQLILSLVRDVTERKRFELLNEVLYHIANSAMVTSDLEELIGNIRINLSKLIDTSNFYIALYNENSGMLQIPYEKDEKDNIETWPAKGSVTGIVIEEKQAMLLKKPDIHRLIRQKKINQVGSMCEAWLGVPLFSGLRVIGALVVQSYENPDAFTKDNMDMLGFVSSQISMAIQRKSTQQALMEAKIKAEESNQLKTSFLKNLSHEVRNPINTILGFSEILQNGTHNPEKVRQLTGIIGQSALHLMTVIDDIINMSSIETDTVKVNQKTCNINELMENISHQLQPQAKIKGIEFRLSGKLTNEEALAITDPTKLTQVISNLMQNAIKFTREGHVELGCTLHDSHFQFQVSDTGIGISEEDQSVIFEQFRQVDNEHTGGNAGMGLGLAIAKSYVELLGGRIWLESTPGKGSTFFFSVPKGRKL